MGPIEKGGRDDVKERLYCARYRLKTRMRIVCTELEDTLTGLGKQGLHTKNGEVSQVQASSGVTSLMCRTIP